jgi:hypothetical protein
MSIFLYHDLHVLIIGSKDEHIWGLLDGNKDDDKDDNDEMWTRLKFCYSSLIIFWPARSPLLSRASCSQ